MDVTFRCGVRARLSLAAYSWFVNAYRNGLIGRVNCVGIVAYLYGVVRFFINGDGDLLFIMPDGVKLKYIDPFTIAETWLYDVHFLGFDLSNWLVVDVGAFVVAVEPVPSHFEAMLRNIELNPELKPRILPINAAIADKDGYVEIHYSGQLDGEVSIYERKGFRARVPSMRLPTLIREISRSGIDLSKFKVKALKMDCKGCEWDVVSNETDVLRLFDIIRVEYAGYLRKLHSQ